jgi:hypothetical protein
MHPCLSELSNSAPISGFCTASATDRRDNGLPHRDPPRACLAHAKRVSPDDRRLLCGLRFVAHDNLPKPMMQDLFLGSVS